MKRFIYWKITLLRDKNIPTSLVTFIDWLRHQVFGVVHYNVGKKQHYNAGFSEPDLPNPDFLAKASEDYFKKPPKVSGNKQGTQKNIKG